VSKPDVYAGELPIAYVQLVKGAKATAADLAAFAAQHVPERPAAPKEVIILEAMPLTDIEKPDKPRLRYDAAERAFAEVFRAALGAQARFAVRAGTDESQATIITVDVAGDTVMRADVERRIADAMKGYTLRHVINWT
jgi:fatty-acyl-CoA synthase